MINRRHFLQASAAGAALLMTARRAYPFAQSPQLSKWSQPIRGLGGAGIPVASPSVDPVFGVSVDYYEMTAREFTDQLHPSLPATTLWGYNPAGNPTQRHLGGVVVATRNKPVRIRFTNALPPTHIIPVDTTIPDANQQQNRMAVHLHGGLVPWISDGGPFSWFDPFGNHGPSFQNNAILDQINPAQLNGSNSSGGAILPSLLPGPGQADYFYPNNQSARLVWYHDHAVGITRVSAYAGVASAYIITDTSESALIASGALPGIGFPIVFQDKIFVSSSTTLIDPTWSLVAQARVQSPGSLWYAHVYEPKR